MKWIETRVDVGSVVAASDIDLTETQTISKQQISNDPLGHWSSDQISLVRELSHLCSRAATAKGDSLHFQPIGSRKPTSD